MRSLAWSLPTAAAVLLPPAEKPAWNWAVAAGDSIDGLVVAEELSRKMPPSSSTTAVAAATLAPAVHFIRLTSGSLLWPEAGGLPAGRPPAPFLQAAQGTS